MRTYIITGIAAILLGASSVTAATAEINCVAAVETAKANWRAVSHASFLKASQHIRTADGRNLTGAQINYSHVLIARAETVCGAGQAEQSQGYVVEANEPLHPTSRGFLAASPANK
jgi:hypothetical protein